VSAPAQDRRSGADRRYTTRQGGASFVKLADALTFDPDVSDGALRAYSVLAAYGRSIGSATFELAGDQLGTLLGRSHDQANRRTRELERLGLLSVRRRRGYGQPNLFTVLDPHDCLWTGLRVERGSASPGSRGSASSRTRISASPRDIGEREKREHDDARPVDNGAATPRPPSPAECTTHRGQPAHSCRSCRADRLAGDIAGGVPF
jgi:hypothetical protein